MSFARLRQATRFRQAAYAVAAFGAASAIVSGSLLGGASAPAQASSIQASSIQASTIQASRVQAAATSHVLVNCAGKDQTRPSSFRLTCADANWRYEQMHWQIWGATAYATATSYINDCYPNCAQGKFYSFPTLVVTWRPEPLPGHSGERYYTRLGWAFKNKACLPSPPKGKVTCLPRTGTIKLVDWK